MNKIVSNFYLIRLDGEPVYVGYTNRPIKQRFSEHKHDKDFGDIKPTLESLGNLEYDFTWDMGLINQYAKEVSDRETELIIEHNTQDSIWQKGLSSAIGGQTWSNIKYFVRTNRDNPTFREMKDSDIIMMIEWQRISYKKLKNMVSNTNINGDKKLNNMVNYTDIKGARKLKSMVINTDIKGARKLKSMVITTNIKGAQKLKNMVKHTNVKGAQKLGNMIKITNIKGAQKLNDMVKITNIKGAQKLKNMVNHTKAKP